MGMGRPLEFCGTSSPAQPERVTNNLIRDYALCVCVRTLER